MFFKREKTKVLTFGEQMDELRSLGYEVESARGSTRVRKGNLAAVLTETPEGGVRVQDLGIALGDEVALLTDLGYQKIFLAPSGRKLAAVADHLKALHSFGEDLREALHLTSLYNEGLGTTNEKHLYDRVEHRDHGATRLPWQRN